MADELVLFSQQGHAGIITLNRPKALNALTFSMVDAISLQLLAWRDDPTIATVIIQSGGGRAFCAGGDIAEVVRIMDASGLDAAQQFFRHEYRLNWRIKNYPKPYVALIDGIVMGGGFGVSAHGHFRVHGAKTMMAMPETAIGFFPDVGGTYVLSRVPGELGMFLALTGARLNGEETVLSGVGTHFSGEQDQAAILTELSQIAPGDHAFDAVRATLDRLCPPISTADRNFAGVPARHIDQLFQAGDYAAIQAALAADDNEFANQQLARLNGMSPLSLHVTARQIRLGATLDFAACLQLEYQLVRHFLLDSDFREGVRAMVVDKDRNPQWRDELVAAVDNRDAMLERFFSPVVEPLTFDWTGL